MASMTGKKVKSQEPSTDQLLSLLYPVDRIPDCFCFLDLYSFQDLKLLAD